MQIKNIEYLPSGLSPDAIELIRTCPHIINRLAEQINTVIDNFKTSLVEDDEISHVGYTDEQCGREK